MKNPKRSSLNHGSNKTFLIRPSTFIFFEKTTGARCLEVPAFTDGSLPTDEASSLLAVHCILRGRIPKNVDVLIKPSQDLLCGVKRRANKLIKACHLAGEVHLTFRQQGVVQGLMHDLSNKELSDKMNIGVRTIKFHMAALFQKFSVSSRASLKQKASDLISAGLPTVSVAVDQGTGTPLKGSRERELLGLNAAERRHRAVVSLPAPRAVQALAPKS
jgi:DNA-binding CsgD family transcriptional regulator